MASKSNGGTRAGSSGNPKGLGAASAAVKETSEQEVQSIAPSRTYGFTANDVVNKVGSRPSIYALRKYFADKGFEVWGNDEHMVNIESPSKKVRIRIEENDPSSSSDWYEMKAEVFRREQGSSFYDRRFYKEGEYTLRTGTYWRMPEIIKGNVGVMLDKMQEIEKRYRK